MSEQTHNDERDEPIATGQSSQEPAEGDVSPGEQSSEQGQSSEQDTTG